MWTGSVLFSEGDWEIEVSLLGFETEDKAKRIADSSKSAWNLVLVEQTSAIQMSFDGWDFYYYDADIVIKELTPQKRAQMVRSLDARDSSSNDEVLQALMSGDPTYIIELEDMVPSDKTLADFLKRYGPGYSLEPIASGVSGSD